MINRAGIPSNVYSLSAWRKGERRTDALTVPVRENAGPTRSSFRQPIKDGNAPDFARLARDRRVAPGTFDLDMRRYANARARFNEDIESFHDWTRTVRHLLMRHLAYMTGFEGNEQHMHAAYASGMLAPSHFRADVDASPFEDDLLAYLGNLAEGMRSPSHEIACEAIVLSANIACGMKHRANDDAVVARARAITDAAVNFFFASDVPADNERVAQSVQAMVTRIPAANSPVAQAEIAFHLGARTTMGLTGNATPAMPLPTLARHR